MLVADTVFEPWQKTGIPSDNPWIKLLINGFTSKEQLWSLESF